MGTQVSQRTGCPALKRSIVPRSVHAATPNGHRLCFPKWSSFLLFHMQSIHTIVLCFHGGKGHALTSWGWLQDLESWLRLPLGLCDCAPTCFHSHPHSLPPQLLVPPLSPSSTGGSGHLTSSVISSPACVSITLTFIWSSKSMANVPLCHLYALFPL